LHCFPFIKCLDINPLLNPDWKRLLYSRNVYNLEIKAVSDEFVFVEIRFDHVLFEQNVLRYTWRVKKSEAIKKVNRIAKLMTLSNPSSI